MIKTIQRIANAFPETRGVLVPLLRKHACGCGDGVLAEDFDELFAGDLDEMFAGRAYTTPNGPDGAENKKDFGDAPSMGGPGNWKGEKKQKCFYETGDEADRCYVTTNGSPGGQTKPDTGSAGSDGSSKRQEYNEKYRKQRWNKGASERLAELRAIRAAADEAKKMKAKGYKFKVTFDAGKPEPLYTKTKAQADQAMKDHGKGKVTTI